MSDIPLLHADSHQPLAKHPVVMMPDGDHMTGLPVFGDVFEALRPDVSRELPSQNAEPSQVQEGDDPAPQDFESDGEPTTRDAKDVPPTSNVQQSAAPNVERNAPLEMSDNTGPEELPVKKDAPQPRAISTPHDLLTSPLPLENTAPITAPQAFEPTTEAHIVRAQDHVVMWQDGKAATPPDPLTPARHGGGTMPVTLMPQTEAGSQNTTPPGQKRGTNETSNAPFHRTLPQNPQPQIQVSTSAAPVDAEARPMPLSPLPVTPETARATVQGLSHDVSDRPLPANSQNVAPEPRTREHVPGKLRESNRTPPAAQPTDTRVQTPFNEHSAPQRGTGIASLNSSTRNMLPVVDTKAPLAPPHLIPTETNEKSSGANHTAASAPGNHQSIATSPGAIMPEQKAAIAPVQLPATKKPEQPALQPKPDTIVSRQSPQSLGVSAPMEARTAEAKDQKHGSMRLDRNVPVSESLNSNSSAKQSASPNPLPNTTHAVPSFSPAIPAKMGTSDTGVTSIPSEQDAELLSPLLPRESTGLAQASLSPSRQPALARHVAAQIAAAAMAENRSVELRLNPEELGRVRLLLSSGESTIAVTIMAERGETLDLMRRHISQLEGEFRDIGYDNVTFAFGSSQQEGAGQQNTQQGNGGGSHKPAPLTSEASQNKAGTPALPPVANGLDLRV